jgi:hypothetical protein
MRAATLKISLVCPCAGRNGGGFAMSELGGLLSVLVILAALFTSCQDQTPQEKTTLSMLAVAD